MDTQIVYDIFSQITPFAITFSLLFGCAEFIFKWFFRFIFGRYISSDM